MMDASKPSIDKLLLSTSNLIEEMVQLNSETH